MIFLGSGYSMLSWIMLLVQPIEQEHSYTANSCVEQRQERYNLANEKGESER
jgi:heme exporter protein D